MIVEADNEEDILSLDVDNYADLMDQLHPLREAELVDIFPALKLFIKDEVPEDGKTRQTAIGLKLAESEAKKNSDRKSKARASLIGGRPSINLK